MVMAAGGIGATSGGDFSIGNLLQNKLFLSFLSKAGAGLAQNDAVSGIDQLTQQLIGAKSASDLQAKRMNEFKNLLQGKGAEGSSFKIGKDGQIIATFGDRSSLSGSMSLESAEATAGATPGEVTPEQNAIIGGLLRGDQLPSSGQSGASYSELAGLSKEDVSRIGKDALQSETAKAGIDYRQALGEQARAQARTIPYQARTARLRESRLSKPDANIRGLGVTAKEFNALPTRAQEYLLAKKGAEILGDSEFMTKDEWERTSQTERSRFISEVAERPEMLETIKDISEATQQIRQPQQRPLVTWTTATNEVTKRFGKLDPTGMWAVTPKLQYTHREAQRHLVELKDSGMNPLKAVGEAEDYAKKRMNTREENYYILVDRYRDNPENIEKIKSSFYKSYGYIPAGVVR